MTRIVKIALDTSCLNVKRKNLILNLVEQMEQEGKVVLVTSTVNEKEQLASNQDLRWQKEYLEKINRENKSFEVGRYGLSGYGSAVYGDARNKDILDKALGEYSGQKQSDQFDRWLIETAIVAGVDYFLTMNSNDFIVKDMQAKLEVSGIKIREPNENFLRELQNLILNVDL